MWLQANDDSARTHVTCQGVTERLDCILTPLVPLHFLSVLSNDCKSVNKVNCLTTTNTYNASVVV